MIEKTLLNYLSSKMSPTNVYMEKPETLPDSFITIQKTGSGRSGYVDTATFAVQCWAQSLYDAAAMNDNVKRYMAVITKDCDNVMYCSLNGDYNYTDTATKTYRYQAVFDLVFMEDY